MLHLYWHKTGLTKCMCVWVDVDVQEKEADRWHFRASWWLKCWVLWKPWKQKLLTVNIWIGQQQDSHIPNVRWLIKATLSPAQSKQWAEASYSLTLVTHSIGLSWSEYFHRLFMCVFEREREKYLFSRSESASDVFNPKPTASLSCADFGS